LEVTEPEDEVIADGEAKVILLFPEEEEEDPPPDMDVL
jgi:hypothetical protein